MNLVLLYVWEDARVWVHWNHSFDMHLNYLRLVSCMFSSWIPSECTVEGGCSSYWLDGRNILFLNMAGDVPFTPLKGLKCLEVEGKDGEGSGNPLQCSCLENLRDGGAWWAAACGVAPSWTWLKQLSSSSSRRERTYMNHFI